MKQWLGLLLCIFCFSNFWTVQAESKAEVTKILRHIKDEDDTYDQLRMHAYGIYFTLEGDDESIETVHMMMVPKKLERDYEIDADDVDRLKDEYLNDEYLLDDELYQYVSTQLPEDIILEVYLAFKYPDENQGSLDSWMTSGDAIKVYQNGEKVSESYDDYKAELYPKEYFAEQYTAEEIHLKNDQFSLQLFYNPGSNQFLLGVTPLNLSADEISLLNENQSKEVAHLLGFEYDYLDDHYAELSSELAQMFEDDIGLSVFLESPDGQTAYPLYDYVQAERIVDQTQQYRVDYAAHHFHSQMIEQYPDYYIVGNYQDGTYTATLSDPNGEAFTIDQFKQLLDLRLDKDKKFYHQLAKSLGDEFSQLEDQPEIIVQFQTDDDTQSLLLTANRSKVDFSQFEELQTRNKLVDKIEKYSKKSLSKAFDLNLTNTYSLLEEDFQPEIDLVINQDDRIKHNTSEYNVFARQDYLYQLTQKHAKEIKKINKNIKRQFKVPLDTIWAMREEGYYDLYEMIDDTLQETGTMRKATQVNDNMEDRVSYFVDWLNAHTHELNEDLASKDFTQKVQEFFSSDAALRYTIGFEQIDNVICMQAYPARGSFEYFKDKIAPAIRNQSDMSDEHQRTVAFIQTNPQIANLLEVMKQQTTETLGDPYYMELYVWEQ